MDSGEKKNILVVDDDREIVRAIALNLESEGYNVFKAYDGMEALDLAMTKDIHLILIDVMMPKLDGLSAIMKIRERKNLPIIVLSAKSEDSDKVIGLSMGADDYVTKPFNPIEVMARVKSQLRRFLQLGGGTVRSNVLHIGGIELDDDAKTVKLDGETVNLTPKEYDILRFLMQNPGKVFSPSEIYRRVWDDLPLNADNALAVHIRHIREKIEYNPAEPRYLKVVWGKGYKMEADSR